MIETSLFLGFLAAIGILILMYKIGIRKVVKCDPYLDVIITGGLTVLFAGTILGLATAVVAGVIVSGALFLIKKRIEKTTPPPPKRFTVRKR